MPLLQGDPAELAGQQAGGLAVAGVGACLRAQYIQAASLLVRLNRHDAASAAHSVRVAGITMAMWRAAAARPDHEPLGDAETALIGSLLHDVGKLGVPRALLASDAALSSSELAVIRSHAARGGDLLAAMGFPEAIVAIARGHHERWTGGGYPSGRGARGQAPIVRIVAVADAFDAMTDPRRGYRRPLSRAEALKEVAACAGTHFDPAAAELLIETEDGAGEQAAPALSSWNSGRAALVSLALVAVH